MKRVHVGKIIKPIFLSSLKPVPYEKIVELIEFESRDPRFGGEMTMTTSLTL